MTLAIFDLDNTLIAGDSDHGWGQFLVDKGLVDGEHYQSENDRFYADYQRGELDIIASSEFALTPLTQFSIQRLRELHNEFMQTVIAPMRLTKSDALIEHHRQSGHSLLIITATNRFVTQPIAQALGIDEMLATEPEMVDGVYTGKVVDIPCYQDGKVKRLEAWLERQSGLSLEGSYFYSDSINDLPLLKIVDNPVAVDPDEKLRAEAQYRGWEIISLRD